MTQKRHILILALLIASNGFGSTGVLPLHTPLYDFVYDRRLSDYFHSSAQSDDPVAPVWLSDNDSDALPITLWHNDSLRPTITLFGFALEEFRAARYQRATARESIMGGWTIQPSSRMAIYFAMSLDERKASDPHYTGKKWRGMAGGIDQAFLMYASGSITALVGRFNGYWGEYRSLALGPHNALDGYEFRYRWGRLSLSYRLGKLDGRSPERDTIASFENRYVAAHRIDVSLCEKVRIGFYEMAVFGGPGRQLDISYLNPIVPFHVSQLNDNNDDNTLIGIDATWYPKRSTRIHVELLIDDFQVDKNIQSDFEPNEIAVSGSIYQADVFKGCDIAGRYERVTNRTFNQPLPRNRYLFEGRPIGNVYGNDYDRWELNLRRWMSRTTLLDLSLAYHRQGEGRIADVWTTPWLEEPGYYYEPFPTGTVEERLSVALRCAGYIKRFCYFDVSAGLQTITNEHHFPSPAATTPFVTMTIFPFWSTRIAVGD